MALNTAIGEAKATRDKAIAMANSIKSKQERLIRVANKEAEEKMAKVVSNRDEAIKALEEERAD